MRRTHMAALLAALAAIACSPDAPAVTATAPVAAEVETDPALAPVEPLDYADTANWLCRPETQEIGRAHV